MTQNQITTIQSFIAAGNRAIEFHLKTLDRGSQRQLEFTVGRALGAYSMLGDTCPDAHIHARMQALMSDYEASTLLTLHP